MATLLVIHSSPNLQQSHTRALAARYVSQWRARHPDGRVIERDLALTPPPHLDMATIGAFYTPEAERGANAKEAIALSDALVAELLAADDVVIGAPMHNFSVPSALKAWIDHICRVGVTFRYTEQGPQGLLGDKRAVLISARGGNYSSGSPASGMNHQDTYLRTVMSFIGITDVATINAEGVASGEAGLDEAQSQIDRLHAA
ncbi:FMN-dependent NADH-azoreductase [Ferrimonas balearica]|uniref:FMN-dependent NADH-azoreductase n=1 Tax=Ferrimonas balearica TaxID=44012 RepID=UPI001F30D833|nr:FMN-dependent NADH-azoreductase [Ferrimonas balearica]MBY6095003.1 FMN-dependent NADH-azoreductase [Ferrimonas balearica]